MLSTTVPPPTGTTSEEREAKERKHRWSVRRTVFFCLMTCGAFWGFLAFFVLKIQT
jgi:hypothetical protein